MKKKKEGGFVSVDDNLPVKVGRVEKMSKSKKNVVDPENNKNFWRRHCAIVYAF